jgi:hypothetical protein
MGTAFSQESLLETPVIEFLRQHNAEAEFQTVCELVRDCFPELRSLRFGLLEDPDEEGRTWLVLHGTLPKCHPPDLLLGQRRQYHNRFVNEVPLSHCPLFGLLIDFAQE